MFKWLKRKFETRQAITTPVDQLSSLSYDYLTPLSFKDSESYLPTVIACIDLICNSLGSLPVKIVRFEGKRREVLDNHYLMPILTNPNPQLNGFGELMRISCRQLLAFGNAIIVIERKDGEVRLTPVPWGYCTVPYRDNPDVYYINWPNNERLALPPSQVIHVRLASDDGGYIGKPPLARGGSNVALIKLIEQATHSQWKNACFPSLCLTTKKTLQPAQREDARKALVANFAGGNLGKPMLLDNELTVTPISTNAQHNQHFEQRMLGLVQICQVFGVSPVLVQDLRFGTYTNFAEARKQFVAETLSTYQLLFADAMNVKLLPDEPSTKISIDATHLLQTRAEHVTEMSILVEKGILDAEEARRELGYG